MKKALALVFLYFVFSVNAFTIAVIGQSNAVGQYTASPYNNVDGNRVKVFNGSEWVPAAEPMHGVGATFMSALANRLIENGAKGELRFIPCAVNGVGYLLPNNNEWSDLNSTSFKNSVTKIRNAGGCDAMIFFCGESDYHVSLLADTIYWGIKTTAKNYRDSISDMPIFLIKTQYPVSQPSTEVRLGQQIALDSINNFYLLADPYGFQTYDNLHFTKVGQDSIGNVGGNSTTLIDMVRKYTDRSGNKYTSTRIGKLEFLNQNFRDSTYLDGTVIPKLTDATDWTNDSIGAYCFYGNSSDTSFMGLEGALYNWFSLNNASSLPIYGWRVPSSTEWTAINDTLIARGYNYDSTTTGNKTGKSLAKTSGWSASATVGHVGNDQATNNRTGLNIPPAGIRGATGTYANRQIYAFLWSSNQSSAANANNIYLAYNAATVSSTTNDKNIGCSVRLIRNLHTLKFTSSGNGSVSGDTLQLVGNKDTCSPVLATASTGYVFDMWSDSSLQNPRYLIATQDDTLYASFKERSSTFWGNKYFKAFNSFMSWGKRKLNRR